MICVRAAEVEFRKACSLLEVATNCLPEVCSLVAEYYASKQQLFEEDLHQRYWVAWAEIAEDPTIRDVVYTELVQLAPSQPLIAQYLQDLKLVSMALNPLAPCSERYFAASLVTRPNVCNRLSCFYSDNFCYGFCNCHRPIIQIL